MATPLAPGSFPTSRGILAFALAAAVLSAAAQASRAQDEVMRTEDVVRMLVSGVAVDRVVGEIRSRSVDFDLSEDMLAELRIAGVPKSVIEAMQARQAELAPPEPEPADEVEPAPLPGLLRVVLWTPPAEDDDDAPEAEAPAVVFPGKLSAAAAEALRIPAADGPPTVEALAVFLACRTAYHVPDHWRSKSPLGRDFATMPRHRMLAFVHGEERVARDGPLTRLSRRLADAPEDLVRLELPPALEARVDPAEAHDLSVGMAIRVQGRWLRVQSDDRDGVRFEGPELILRAEVGPAETGPGIAAVFEDGD